MAPSLITEDYYKILELEQTAAPQLINSAYRRLALKLHPDRNAEPDATEAFQRLGRAYETLKDESKRRAYDLVYPSITRRRSSPQNTRASHSPPTSTSQSDTLREEAQVAAIQKSKQERSARWRTKKNVFDSSIFELQRSIRRLEQEIANLVSILAAEAAVEAQKNSWGAWLLSPLYKRAEDSEEEKERKDRARQERRIEKDFKERRLISIKADLKIQENLHNNEEEKVNTANRSDDEKIRVIQATRRAREDRQRRENERQRQEKERREREKRESERRERERQEWERQESERKERERQESARMADFWKKYHAQREKQEREAAEASRKQREKERAAAQHRKATSNFHQPHEHPHPPQANTSQAYTSACRHDGWWPKVQGRTACPTCYESWTYLLQCPDCMVKACPRCQAAMRPRMPRNATRPTPTIPRRVRTPSPNFDDYYDW